jgi:acetyl-CoA carboxylase biotin carboxyl carrier protein
MSANDPNQTHPQGAGQGAAGGSQQQQSEGGQQERGGPNRQQQQSGQGRHRRGGGGGGGGRQPQRGQGSGQQSQRRAESTLNLEELRELTELFSEHGLTDFEFENADIRIRLSRNPASPQAPSAPPPPAPAPPPIPAAPATPAGPAAGQPEPAPAAEPAAEDLHVITSPIVGTFYRSPSPTSEPFVKAGSQVEPATVVCIIEAMKLMNEIQAETSGTVEKIFVENGQPVEYGQPLFGIKR